MKGKAAIYGIVMILAILTATAWADMTVPVSPGGGTEVIVQDCPTFSWSAATAALSYEIEVYEQMTDDNIDRDAMRGMGNPVVEKEIPAPALSWSPSSGECLLRGMKYVWYVRGVDKHGQGQWSGGLGFQVESAALSADQKEAVQDVVKGYLSGEKSGGETTSGATEQFQTTDAITPMYTEGIANNFFGTNAGANISSGYANTFIGSYAGFHTTTGFSDSFLGYGAGGSNIGGYSNTYLGTEAGYNETTGNANVFLGFRAGYSETGSNKLYIDNCYTGGSSCTQPLIKGDFVTRTLQIDGSLTIVTVATPSDIRYKKDIHPLKSSLEKVLELRGVTYEWDKDKVHGAGFREGKQIGLIAQEVEKVLPELVHTDRRGYKTLSYDKLVPVLIEAVKDQQKEITEQKAAIAKLQDKLEKSLRMIVRRLASLGCSAKTIANR